MRYLFTCLLIVLAAGASAETYRWTDTSGNTVISDTPPQGKAKGLSRLGGKGEPDDKLSFAMKRAVESFPVVLYTSADCPGECKAARDLLNSRGIPFTEKVMQKPEDFEELKQLIGDVFVPSLKVGSQRFRGFEAGAYNNLLDLASYPKSAPPGSKPAVGASK
ncbi:glutaredoxin family protein [Dechloromonas sp. HYN0024]|uniref:glutaredoxin family protein n=1 Tax=Dechloromonas sp. HYN0024 TaxID=2231055 RepID=UPI000E4506C2|nr:glutaredoxin family protein [Dechloromonas sp. HYN0024]AXS80924.1 glutaredoxin family protein [Dechloromonas sp. HYN0024]